MRKMLSITILIFFIGILSNTSAQDISENNQDGKSYIFLFIRDEFDVNTNQVISTEVRTQAYKAYSDEEAYFQAYSRVCSDVIGSHLMKESGVCYYRFKTVLMLNPDSKNILSDFEMPRREEKEKAVWESLIRYNTPDNFRFSKELMEKRPDLKKGSATIIDLQNP